MAGVRRYVALGDSSSAGLPDDPHPPWTELLVADLRRESQDLAFHNLAVVGAASADVVREQLVPAVELEPDLVTLVCGMNDVLWSVRPDRDAYRASLQPAVERLLRTPTPPLVVLATMADVSPYLPFGPRSSARVARGVAAFNPVVREVAACYGCALVDVERSPYSSDPASYAPDGIHSTRAGHIRIAEGMRAAIAEALGAVALAG